MTTDDFMLALSGELLRHGAEPFSNESASSDEDHFSMVKVQGSVLYAYHIIKAPYDPELRVAALRSARKYRRWASLVKNPYSHVISSFIFVCDEDGFPASADELLGESVSFEGQEKYSLYYAAEPESGSFITSPVQKDDLADAGKLILRALKNTDAKPISPALPYKRTALTFALIATNIIYAALCFFAGGFSFNYNTLLRLGGLRWDLVTNDLEVWRLISSMFMHSGLPHLAANMLSLYIFGTRAEKCFGPRRFALIYICSGIASGLSYYFMPGLPLLIGASGAIFGLSAAVTVYAIQTGKRVDGVRGRDLMLMTLASLAIGFGIENTANVAHAAGLIVGAGLGWRRESK